MILVESKRKKIEGLQKKYPNAIIADVTSKSNNALIKLSPFYPWGDIPVPYTPNMVATCVEAVWQGLKVFEKADVDVETFKNDSMHRIKRTTNKFGKIIGHRRGVNGHVIFNYIDARKNIYIRSYRWMLENKALNLIKRMREINQTNTIILLDYSTNCDIFNLTKPLSHAYLVKAYIEGLYPFEDVKIKKIHNHFYCGRKVITWTTEETEYKEIQHDKNDPQLLIDFDL